MLKDVSDKLIETFLNNNVFSLNIDSKMTEILPRLYAYYQYYNADETTIDDLEDLVFDFRFIHGIFKSQFDELDAFDFLYTLDLGEREISQEFIREKIIQIDSYFTEIFNGAQSGDLNEIRKIFINLEINDERHIHMIIISDKQPDPVLKSLIKDYVSNFKSKMKNIDYVMFFADDILETINDVEKPTLNVNKGQLVLTDKDQFLFHGLEKSIITSVSAKSIKELYLRHATNGLFSSNLRYYVKSARIDSNIKNSIINEPDKFWYFNNGLIITCENYSIKDGYIELSNFSIVNGGQTTNLIGNTPFENDFSVTCKIIKNKYEDADENLDFLSKIAETSNTQKPIKTKDLIANRIEQKKLKQQLKEVNIFVQIKRGEKINKFLYPEKWQNATNDEIGQIIFSTIYQHPGIARNSKSKMLENEGYYNTIYRSNYNTLFLLSMQHFKVGYHKWALKIKKHNDDSNKIGLSRNGFFLFTAVLGFILKIYYNKDFMNLIEKLDISHDFYLDNDFKKLISQNDIGELSIFKTPSLISESQNADLFFEYVYEYFVLPSYTHFKKINPSYAYSNFTKNDTYYYRFVIPKLVSVINQNWIKGIKHKDFFDKYFDDANKYSIGLVSQTDLFEEHKPGLSIELNDYRKMIYQKHQGKLQAYLVFTNQQRSRISFYKPQNIKALKLECGLTDYSISNFGEDILKIVQKYVVN